MMWFMLGFLAVIVFGSMAIGFFFTLLHIGGPAFIILLILFSTFMAIYTTYKHATEPNYKDKHKKEWNNDRHWF